MRSRRMAAVAAWTVAAVLVAGCSDDEPDRRDDPGPSGSDTTSATAGSDGSSSGAPSDTSSGSAVEPATGQQVRMESGISFRLTEGPDWVVEGNGTFGVVGDAELESGELVLIEGSELDALTDDLEVAANGALTTFETSSRPTLRREEDREVNGVTGYVIRSESDESNFYLFGVLYKGTAFRLSLEVPLEAELEEWVEPILASIEWS